MTQLLRYGDLLNHSAHNRAAALLPKHFNQSSPMILCVYKRGKSICQFVDDKGILNIGQIAVDINRIPDLNLPAVPYCDINDLLPMDLQGYGAFRLLEIDMSNLHIVFGIEDLFQNIRFYNHVIHFQI